MFALDKPAVGLAASLLENTLGGDAHDQPIGEPALTWDDDVEASPIPVAESVHFAHCCRRIR